jgi:penicillin-binding protein 1C
VTTPNYQLPTPEPQLPTPNVQLPTSKRRGIRSSFGALGVGRLKLAVCTALAVLAWLRLGPLPPGLLDEAKPSTIVLDRKGTPLYEAGGGDGTRAIKLTADDLPATLVAATIAAEDRRFWSHAGVDPIAIARAIRTNVVDRSIVEGGSTITQQVAKLLLNRRDPKRTRGWSAKIDEAVIAVRLEHRLDKREILAMYLNLAGYGNQISGAERASRAYFGISVPMLTPAQAALLAGLPQRPSGFNPYRNREAAVSRQRAVLRRMQAAGALTAQQEALARDERLAFKPAASAFVAPHFVEMVLASEDARPAERIQTTLDEALQAQIAGIIESHRSALRRHGAANVAIVVLDNATAEWLAWEGSGDYLDTSHGGAINGPTVPRQPGSALKPFTYALAFEEGYSPASVLADVPSSFPTADPGVVYSPRNYDGRYRGPMLARAALAGSENVPAVALASELGVPKLLRFVTRVGLTTFDRTAGYYGLGLTLGNAEVRLDQLTAAYSALARGGEWREPTWLAHAPARPVRRIVSARSAFWITDILSDDEAREFVFGRGGSLEFPFPVAVKTGTSQAYHDNWTIGYSRHVTVGVWVGNFDRTPLRNSSGVTGAAPIFHAVMLAAEQRARSGVPGAAAERIVPPPDVIEREVCALSGLAANTWCPNRKREWVATESPDVPCSWHHVSDEGVLTILPPEYAAWSPPGVHRAVLQSSRTLDESARASMTTRTSAHAGGGGSKELRNAGAFAIASPADGATYLIDPTLRGEFQTLSLKAVAASGSIQWTVNGRAIGTSDSNAGLEWSLVPGRHQIAARDARGRIAEASITVR